MVSPVRMMSSPDSIRISALATNARAYGVSPVGYLGVI